MLYIAIATLIYISVGLGVVVQGMSGSEEPSDSPTVNGFVAVFSVALWPLLVLVRVGMILMRVLQKLSG